MMKNFFGNTKQRFSLRKFACGVASVIVGVSILGTQPVLADEAVTESGRDNLPGLLVDSSQSEDAKDNLRSAKESGSSLENLLSEQDNEDSLITTTEDLPSVSKLATDSEYRPSVLVSDSFSSLQSTEDTLKELERALQNEAESKVGTSWQANSVDKVLSEITRQEHLGVEHYVVQWGDTLSSIAEASQQEVTVIAKLNNISNPNLIVTGQTLVGVLRPSLANQAALFEIERRRALAGSTTIWTPNTLDDVSREIARQEAIGLDNYIVQWGDTLSVLSTASGKTVIHLADLNRLVDVNSIQTGQSLKGILNNLQSSSQSYRTALTSYRPQTDSDSSVNELEPLLFDFLNMKDKEPKSEEPIDKDKGDELEEITDKPETTERVLPKKAVSGYVYDANDTLLEEKIIGLYLNDELVEELKTDYMGYLYAHLETDKSYHLKADDLAIQVSVDNDAVPTILSEKGRFELGRTFAEEGEDDKFRLKSQVIYVDDSRYTTESNDGKTVILSNEVKAQVGDILVIPPSKIHETSAAIKVLEIVNKDGQSHITYEEPNFLDVFTEFTLKNETIDLADAVFVPADGVTVVSENRSDDGALLRSIEIDKGELVFKDFIKKLKKSELTISMKGEVSPTIDFNLIEGLKEFSIEGKFEPELTFAVANGEFEPYEKESNLWGRKKRLDEELDEIGDKLYATLGTFHVPIPASLGSVGFQLSLLARLSAEGEWSLGFGSSLNIPFAWSSKDSSVKPKDEDFSFNIDFIKAALEGEVGVGPVLKGGLKALATDIASLETYGSLSLAGEVETGLSLDRGILDELKAEKDPEKLKEIAQKVLGLGGKLEGKLKAGVDLVFDLIEKWNEHTEESLKDKTDSVLESFKLPEKLSLLSKEWTLFKFGFGTEDSLLDFSKLYKETIDGYRQAILTDDSTADINVLSRVYYKNNELDNFYYAFYDVNKDGVKELIFSPNQTGNIFDIYSLRGEDVVKLSKDTLSMLGERMTLSLLKDGHLYYRGSGGAFSGGGTLYELKGTTVSLHSKHQVEWDFSRFPKEAPYRDIKTGQFYRPEEFIQLFGLDNFVDLSQLDWKTLFESNLRPVKLEDETAIRDILQKKETINKFDYLDREIILPWETGKQSVQLEAYKMSSLVDYYNTYRPEVYEIADIVKELGAIVLPQRLDVLSKTDLVELSKKYKSGWLYFSGDNQIVEAVGGGRGGSMPTLVIPPIAEWKKIDNGYEIITSWKVNGTTPFEKVTVKRNQKSYSGGDERSSFYISDVEVLDKKLRLNRLGALAKEVYLKNQGNNNFRHQDLLVIISDINDKIQIRENNPNSPFAHLLAIYRLNNKQFEVFDILRETWSVVSPQKVLV